VILARDFFDPNSVDSNRSYSSTNSRLSLLIEAEEAVENLQQCYYSV
jgi:hypothetical protein